MVRRIGFTVLMLAAAACADEGMWLFNEFPKQAVEKKYHFKVTDAFLDHLRLASVRFNNGGSGSFISPDGLLFTNHHVGSDCIQKISSAEHDYMANGFYAAAPAEERPCPDLEVNVLLKIEDVTTKVASGIPADAPSAEANRRRKAAMSAIEKECTSSTGNRCDVVTLYSGGEYNLYQYKKYTDLRLVFAPEFDIAAFGGDPDNFTYPRYCLDFALFRAYENGKPVKPLDYFRWSRQGVKDKELTFVPGNPGSTGRMMTMAQMEFARDNSYPLIYEYLDVLIKALEAYGDENPENKRVAHDNLLYMQNSYKAYEGFLAGLRDPALMDRKRAEEASLRAAVDRNAELKQKYGDVWDKVAGAYQNYRQFFKQYMMLESFAIRGSDLFEIARNVLRYAEETKKPNGERLREYTDAGLPSLEQEMYSPAPLTDSMETAVIATYLREVRKTLGPEDETVKALLDGKSPEDAARMYVTTSKLKDVAERKRLAGDLEAVKTTDDGMIRLARILDPAGRRYRKRAEDSVEAILTESAAKIAQARFAVYGKNLYPDATFTLRLEYGPVLGYRDTAAKPIPYATVFGGVYARATGKDPYKLPQRWIDAKAALNLKTPFNFVTTVDSHGGNSGSPTLDEKGEIVGILFDGNIESLPNRFIYTETQARSVHVAAQGIIEALRKVYKADRVLKEMGF